MSKLFSKTPESLKKLLRPVYYRIHLAAMSLRYRFNSNPIQDARRIPIIINNRNRLTFMKTLIDSLEKRRYNNIYIIDNASTYPPLLEYYKTCPYEVFRLDKNVGHRALWDTDIYKRFIDDYFIYTDPDVVPVEACPDDFIDFLWTSMKSRPQVYKIGLSVKIDDLPDCFKNKQKVIEIDSKYYKKKINELFYEADVDTTFALYRPGMKHATNEFITMYRTAFPYQLRHLPWYVDSDNLPEEEKYYIANARDNSTFWTKQHK